MITPLHYVQGEGDASPLLGSSVTVSGVVTGDYDPIIVGLTLDAN
jgi:predicted extracellular nuclease